MAYLSYLNNDHKSPIYSHKLYMAYTDKVFNNELDQLLKDHTSEHFQDALDNLTTLFKRRVSVRDYHFITFVPYNNEKFSSLNKQMAESLASEVGIKFVDDVILTFDVTEVDIRDRYYNNEEKNVKFKLNEVYKNKLVLFLDMYCSSGFVMYSLYKETEQNEFKYKPKFINYAIRFDISKMQGSLVGKQEEIKSKIRSKTSSGVVVRIKGLFGNKNINVDLRDDVAIIVGDNGVGKSSAYRIATLSTQLTYSSRIELLRYPFETIYVYLYDDTNQLILSKSIEYFDLLPLKKSILTILKNWDIFQEKYGKTINLKDFGSNHGDEIKDWEFYKQQDNMVKFLDIISQEDYQLIYKKILTDDITYRYFISSLLSENHISLNWQVFVNFLISLLSFPVKYRNSKNCLFGEDTCYYSLTKSRNLKKYLPNSFISYDESTDAINISKYLEDFDTIDEEEMNRLEENKDNLELERDYLEGEYGKSYFNDFSYLDEQIDEIDELLNQFEDRYEDDPGFTSFKEELETNIIKRIEKMDNLDKQFYCDDYIEKKIRNYFYLLFENKEAEGIEPNEYILNRKFFTTIYDYLSIDANQQFSIKNIKELPEGAKSKIRIDYLNKEVIDLNDIVKLINYENSKPLDINFSTFKTKMKGEVDNDLTLKKFIFNEKSNDFNFGLYERLSIKSRGEFEKLILSDNAKTKLYKSIQNYLNEKISNDVPKELQDLERFINKYLSKKKIRIFPRCVIFTDYNDKFIAASALSSGEKNLVLLFFLCSLISFITGEDPKNKFHLILDEPDISMNISWQETIIEDLIKSLKQKAKLTILTQSPQMVQNEQLHPFVYDLLKRNFNGPDNANFEKVSFDVRSFLLDGRENKKVLTNEIIGGKTNLIKGKKFENNDFQL